MYFFSIIQDKLISSPPKLVTAKDWRIASTDSIYAQPGEGESFDSMLLDKAVDTQLNEQRKEENVHCQRFAIPINCNNSKDPFCQEKGKYNILFSMEYLNGSH